MHWQRVQDFELIFFWLLLRPGCQPQVVLQRPQELCWTTATPNWKVYIQIQFKFSFENTYWLTWGGLAIFYLYKVAKKLPKNATRNWLVVVRIMPHENEKEKNGSWGDWAAMINGWWGCDAVQWLGLRSCWEAAQGKKLIAPTLITPVHYCCSCLPCRWVISSQKKRLFRGKVPTTVAESHTTQQRKGTPAKIIVFLAQILVETIYRSKFYATASHASSQTSCTRLFWQVVDGWERGVSEYSHEEVKTSRCY